jgi:putative ATPase
MRPLTLDEVVGQAHIVGPGRLLRRAIEADQLSSVIFFGPPGTGKTTLARVVAHTTRARFVAINAVLGGVKDIREAVAEAKDAKDTRGQRTILFVDEVHRFNKAQQDALLPWVEDGTVTLIGATTENPYFEVNPALVSRSRLFRLEPLREDDLRQVLVRALAEPVRGYGGRNVEIDPEASDHLVDVANGDARSLLNALELAVETTPPDERAVVHVTLAVAEESIQRRAVLYDREGDAHFDTISAFIKSVRGSDPDAALYWLARMVYAGEDPRYIFRRLLVLASEDVGLADPTAVSVVTGCAAAFDRVGLPEGRFHLAHATLALALAAKSNSTMGFFDALAAVEQERTADVPVALKDANRDGKDLGHGQGYQYPHAFRDHWVAQQYLPAPLQGRMFWQPSDQGWEGELRERVAGRREAQLAAMVEAAPEPLSWSPTDKKADRWLQRALGQAGERLARVRSLVLDAAHLERHHVVADLRAESGLLVWELVRRLPEGQVWALASDPSVLASPAAAAPIDPLRRPRIVHGGLADLVREAGEVRFDRAVGRDVIGSPDLASALDLLLTRDGFAAFVEGVPQRTPRLAALRTQESLPTGIHARWVASEEELYAGEGAPFVAFDDEAVRRTFDGWTVGIDHVDLPGELPITKARVERWTTDDGYVARLGLGADGAAVAAALRGLVGHTVPWLDPVARITIRRA